jgi:hypothetical protein
MSLNNLKETSFEEKDKENLVEFLNFIAKKAKFEVDVQEVIKFHGLLSWAQQSLLKKINQNILGEVKLHENVLPPKEKAKSKSKAKAKK